jgi:hypothetical protein
MRTLLLFPLLGAALITAGSTSVPSHAGVDRAAEEATSYCVVALERCRSNCTDNPLARAGATVLSLLYPGTGGVYTAYLGGCVTGCYVAYQSCIANQATF